MADLKPIIENSFTQYSGAVLQSRALVDVRDCLKPSARQIFYCMETDKFTHNKPFRKTLKAMGSAMRMYIHGDSSCEGVIMRAGQPFAMRYPLVEVEGSYGNLMESGNWSAPRYTSARLSEIGDTLFENIQKNTISEWRDNYDDTEQYPVVLSTPGYYNICNGSFGIGIGMSSSIPQFNLREVNEAMEKLLLNPQVSDDEIIPMPDFATGGCLLNPTEVKESLKNGNGKACLLRSVIEYDNRDHCLVVTEIPYSVYTNTICGELEEILNGDDNPGIERFNDLTGEKPLIKIYLNKIANVQTVLKYLYKNTSLQYWYSINLTMLRDGRFPEVFTWREALNAHIEHEKVVYRRAFEFDKTKAETRLNIVEGLLIARAHIDEVIKTIKEAASPAIAKSALQLIFVLDEAQAQAILDMKLSRLTHLEVEKLEKEKISLQNEIDRIKSILNDVVKFNNCLIMGWRNITKKFGDERRTKITPMEEEETPKVEDKEMILMVTNNNELLATEPFSKISTTSKTSQFHKMKFKFGIQTNSLATIYGYDNNGKVTPIEVFKYFDAALAPIELLGFFDIRDKKYIIHVTNKGTVKKSLITEYNGFKRSTAVGKLREGEKIIFVGTANDNDYLYLLGVNNKVSKVSVNDFNATGRMTIGVKGMACDVISATIAGEEENILVFTEDKYKITRGSDYSISGKNALGQVVAENTRSLFVLPKKNFYLIENDTKIEYFGAVDYIVKGKSAQGNKTTKNANIIW